MALIEVYVAGLNRSGLVDRSGGAVNYSRDINSQGTAGFTLADAPDGFVPAHGMEVLIKEDGSDVFGGTIQTRPRAFRGPDSPKQLTFYSIDVASWEQRLAKRRVWRSYTAETFEDIVADLNTDFLSGEGITLNVLAGSVISITFNGETVADCIDILCSQETDGRTWYVTPAKVLTVDIQTATPAPVVLNATNVELNNPAPLIEPDDRGYANTVTVVGGNPELPIMYTAEDAGEIAARAAAEGGSGIHHYTEEDNELVSAGQVQQRAEGILGQKVQLRQRFVGMTNEPGFAIGQLVNIDLPNLDVDVLDPFFIINIETTASPAVNELWHTITAIVGPIDGSWASEYRRNIQPRTIPMQIEATPGLVRVLPEPGVLIHDPPPEPAEVFQGAPSGTMPVAGGGLGITHQEAPGEGLELIVGRGGLAGTGGCPGGQFPGCVGSCFASSRQSVLSGFPIDSAQKPGQVATFCTSWDEVHASSFKASMVVSPDNSLVAIVERNPGFDPVVHIIGLDGSGFRGSVVATGMVDNNTGFEGAWVGDHVYIPGHATGGVIFVIDASDPDIPTLETAFNTTATGTIYSVIPNRAGDALYARETTGSGLFIALDISDPTSITETDTQATGDTLYVSLGLDEDGSFSDPQLIAFRRGGASIINYSRLPLTDAHTFGTLDEGTVPVTTTLMDGWSCIYFTDTAICFRQAVAGSNPQECHVFNVDPTNGVTFVKTLTYSHGVAGNMQQARSYIGHRVAHYFGFGTNAQVTFMVAAFDKIVPYTIEKPLRTDFGGTGVDGREIEKGDLLVGKAQSEPFELLRSITAPEGAVLRKRGAEDLGLAWEGGIGWTQVAIDDSDSPYTPAAEVTVILADASAGAITITPEAVADQFERVLIVKNDGDGSFDVTVDPNGIETIDGDATRVLGQNDVLGITGSVNEWEVLFGLGGAAPFSMRGFIDGFCTQWISDSSVRFFPGVAADVLAGNDEAIIWAPDPTTTTLTKLISATFVEGDGNGGLATGSVAASTEYNLILITKDADPAVVDFTFDVDAAGGNTPAGWTPRRRVGSVFTDGSSDIRPYDQHGDRFTFRSAVADVADLAGTLGTYKTAGLTMPGNQVAIIFCAAAVNATEDAFMRLRGAGETVDVAGNAHAGYSDAGAEVKRVGSGRTEQPVDSNSQLEYTLIGAGAAPTWAEAEIYTQGWLDDRGRDSKAQEEAEDMFVPAGSINQAPFGEIGNVSDLTPDPFSNWQQHNSAAWDWGPVVEGMSMTIPCAQWAGKTVEVFLLFAHVSGTAGGASLKDIKIRLDVGPRALNEAQGAPNDAASFRTDTVIEVAASAGLNQHTPFYVSIGTFDVGAADLVAIFEASRLANDAADTFNATIGAFGCHLVPQ